MITIKIDNRIIDIDPDLAITFNWMNPLFSEDGINEGYSYSFTLPLTARNNMVIDKNKISQEVLVYFKGILLEKGRTLKVKSNQDSIEVNLILGGTNFKKDLEKINMNNLDYERIEICDSEDSPTEKINKWISHMETSIFSPEGKKYFFPYILTGKYFEDSEEESENTMFASTGGLINPFIMGQVRRNFAVPSDYESEKEWALTVAPCPTIKYLLTYVLKYFEYKLKKNDLDSIPEYSDLFVFNNYVKDKFETEGLDTYNTHGEYIDIVDHVPNCSVWNLFKLLNELYDTYFVVYDKSINIYTSKQQLSKPYEDFSKYVLDGFNDEESSVENIKTSYPIAEEEYLAFKNPLATERPFSPQYFPEENFNFNDLTLTHEALKCRYEISRIGFADDFYTYISTPVESKLGFYEYQAVFFQNTPPKSDEYTNDVEKFDMFKVGYFRGVRQTVEWPQGDPEPSAPFDHAFAYSFKELMFFGQNNGIDLGIDYSFGNAAIYINGEDNSFDYYKTQKLKLITGNSKTRVKILKLSLAQLLQLKRWERTKHYISQKNQSFKGIVKELTFTVTNKGISPASVSYYVASSSKRGEFSDDYTNDFNT
jgi:hypothetical protein